VTLDGAVVQATHGPSIRSSETVSVDEVDEEGRRTPSERERHEACSASSGLLSICDVGRCGPRREQAGEGMTAVGIAIDATTTLDTWAPCGLCWGQRRIFEDCNGEGLVPRGCPACLGVGERPVPRRRRD